MKTKKEEFIAVYGIPTIDIDKDAFVNDLNNVIAEAIAEHEARMFPEADDYHKKNGWVLDYSLIQTISDRASNWVSVDGISYNVGFEETEAVLIALRNRNLPAPYREKGGNNE